MRDRAKVLAVFLFLSVLPAAAYAQASITGVVTDSSGAVLPGVTVEAASPVLIEKARATVTDDNGRYQLIDLRPGNYAVTFTLGGFSSVKREGLILAGSAAATVDAQLRVGGVEETVTVSGDTPLVDLQNVTRQTVMDRETVQNLPTGRNYYSLGALIAGVTSSSNDVGGALGDTMSTLTVHGSKFSDQRITNNGVSVMTLEAGGGVGGAVPDVGAATEVTIDTSAGGADLPTGGVRVNFIPRDGGNRFASSSFLAFTTEGLQGSNFTERLRDRGLTSTDKSVRNYDINPSVGGPLKRDALWFWATGRYTSVATAPANIYHNKNAWNPDAWTYEPDLSRRALNEGLWHSLNTRVTWQASPRNKFAVTWQEQNNCRCPTNAGPFQGAIRAPEAQVDRRFPRLQQQHAEWTSPVTNRLLLEVVFMHLTETWGNMNLREQDGNFFFPGGSLKDPIAAANMSRMIPVTEQTTNLTYRMWNTFTFTEVPNYNYRAAVAYVTGTHALKFGINRTHGYQKVKTYDFQPFSYTFVNGVPTQLTMRATPFLRENNLDNDLGIFVQDRWTMDRVTLNLGLRYDYFATSFPEQRLGGATLVPTRDITFAAADNVAWHDLSYRSGATFDLFGTRKTAAKISLNRYLAGGSLALLGSEPNPINTLVNETVRPWTDANRNFIPDCNVTLVAANGECGPMRDPTFGSTRPGAIFDEEILRGFGKREYNWEFSAGVQHELATGLAVDVGYFRRWFGNFRVTDNLAVAASDFDQYSLTVPRDPRLPEGGSYTINGLFDLKPAAFGRAPQNFNALSDTYGKQTEHFNGVDLNVTARLEGGVTLQGGVSTGRYTLDNCEIVAALPEMNRQPAQLGATLPASFSTPAWLPQQWCRQESPFLTQVKFFGTYIVPRIDVLVSGTFQSTPGPLMPAYFFATTPYLLANSTLGRPLAGNTPFQMINIVEPGSMYGERLNQLDLRVGKVLRYGGGRTSVNLDIYNALNKDTVRTINEIYASWQVPTLVYLPRFLKISATFDF